MSTERRTLVTATQVVLALAMAAATIVAGLTFLPDEPATADALNREVVNRLAGEPDVEIVDLHSEVSVDDHTADGIHPNAAGSLLLAERWFEALERTGLRDQAGLTLMPLGDSITERSYRSELAVMLDDAGWDVEMVGSLAGPSEHGGSTESDLAHEGHAGWTTRELLSGSQTEPGAGRLENWLGDHRPDVVLVHAGTNDLFWDDADTATIADRLVAIVDAIKAHQPGTVILVAEIMPFSPEVAALVRSEANR